MVVVGSWVCAAVAAIMVDIETWAASAGRLRRSRAAWWAAGAVFWAAVAMALPGV